MTTETRNDHVTHQGVILTKNGYEQTVILRAMQRAGNNPHLKGHIQEILVQDMRNAGNLLRFDGATTQLTRSTTATTVDLVTVKGGKVIERIQVKDVTSKSGIDKLVKQCAQGKYRSARLVGSEETAKAFNEAAKKAGISKRMTSSGVSSKTTESLAQRAGATGSGTVLSAVGQAAKTGGLVGAAVGAGVATVGGIVRLANGEAELEDVVLDVAKAGAKGGVTGAVSGAAATAAGAGAATAVAALGVSGLTATAVTVGAPVLAAVAAGWAATALWDAIFD